MRTYATTLWFFASLAAVAVFASSACGDPPATSLPIADASPPQEFLPELSETSPESNQTIRFTMDQIRCRAAVESASGKLLEGEIRSLRSQKKDKDTPPGCESECILQILARYRRGQDAAAAMIVGYKIVALDHRERKLTEFESRLEEWRGAIDRLSATGVARPDDSALQAQEDALPDAITRLIGGRAKLKLQLASMLNLGVDCAPWIEVIEPLEVQPGTVDAVSGTQEALCRRQDLQAIQRLCGCITEDNLESTRRMLAVLQPGIGLIAPAPKNVLVRCGLLKDHDAAREVACRKRQCAEVRAARERQIRGEVATAAVHLEEAYERLRVAQELARTASGRVTQRRTLNQIDLGSGSQVIRSELEIFAAEDALIQRKADAREAEILWCAVLDRLLEGCAIQ